MARACAAQTKVSSIIFDMMCAIGLLGGVEQALGGKATGPGPSSF